MASMKAKKGNPFERLVAYNLQQCGYNVTRPDDNTSGVDLVAQELYIECKFYKRLFSWNELVRIFQKTQVHTPEGKIPLVVFKSNRQPILAMFIGMDGLAIVSFEHLFQTSWQSKIPKGYKIWENN